MTLNNIVGTNEGAEEIFKRILQDPRISDLMVFNQVGLCVRSTKESGVSSQYGAHVDNLRRHLDHNLRDADCLGGTVTLVRVNTDKHELLIAPGKSLIAFMFQIPCIINIYLVYSSNKQFDTVLIHFEHFL
ncbi:MAG: hypothetical protein MHMPM18_002459 [Marteilia pararefringens]